MVEELEETVQLVHDCARKLTVLGALETEHDLIITAFQDFVASIKDLLSLTDTLVKQQHYSSTTQVTQLAHELASAVRVVNSHIRAMVEGTDSSFDTFTFQQSVDTCTQVTTQLYSAALDVLEHSATSLNLQSRKTSSSRSSQSNDDDVDRTLSSSQSLNIESPFNSISVNNIKQYATESTTTTITQGWTSTLQILYQQLVDDREKLDGITDNSAGVDLERLRRLFQNTLSSMDAFRAQSKDTKKIIPQANVNLDSTVVGLRRENSRLRQQLIRTQHKTTDEPPAREIMTTAIPSKTDLVDYKHVFDKSTTNSESSIVSKASAAKQDVDEIEVLLESIKVRHFDTEMKPATKYTINSNHSLKSLPPPPSLSQIADPNLKLKHAAIKIQSRFRGYRQRRLFKHECIRKMVVKEIFETEISYVKGLLAIHKSYIVPIQEKLLSPTPILNRARFEQIFFQVKDILEFNATLLSKVDQRFYKWNRWTLISDIFLESAANFQMYTHYVNNYDVAVTSLNECSDQPLFKAFVAQIKLHQEKRSLALVDLLITPIQRVPRYVLMLKELARHTAKTHADFEPLKIAIDRLANVAAVINERKRDSEKYSLLLELQAKIIGAPEGIAIPGRRLLLDGELVEVTDLNKKKTRHIFLFNDVIICTTQPQKGRFTGSERSWEFKWSVKLIHCQVGPIEKIHDKQYQDDDLEEVGIGIVGDERHLLFASTLEDHYRWLQTFEEAKFTMAEQLELNRRQAISRSVSKNFGRVLFKKTADSNLEFVELDNAVSNLRDRISQLNADLRVEAKVLSGLQRLDQVYGATGTPKSRSKVSSQREEASKLLTTLQNDIERHTEVLERLEEYWNSYYEIPEHENMVVVVDRKDLSRALNSSVYQSGDMITLRVAERNL